MIVPVKYSESLKEEILTRRESDAAAAEKTVKEIIGNVKTRGDAALYEYTRAFDKAELKDLKVGEEEIKAALSATGEEYLSILKTAAANITAFHEKQLIKGFEMRIGGKILGEKITPLACAGIYVPGGTAAYPSTVLMNAIPAKIAPRRAGDPAQLIASSEKAVKVLGWKPQYNDLGTIVASAWAWHKNHPHGYEEG